MIIRNYGRRVGVSGKERQFRDSMVVGPLRSRLGPESIELYTGTRSVQGRDLPQKGKDITPVHRDSTDGVPTVFSGGIANLLVSSVCTLLGPETSLRVETVVNRHTRTRSLDRSASDRCSRLLDPVMITGGVSRQDSGSSGPAGRRAEDGRRSVGSGRGRVVDLEQRHRQHLSQPDLEPEPGLGRRQPRGEPGRARPRVTLLRVDAPTVLGVRVPRRRVARVRGHLWPVDVLAARARWASAVVVSSVPAGAEEEEESAQPEPGAGRAGEVGRGSRGAGARPWLQGARVPRPAPYRRSAPPLLPRAARPGP